MVCRKRFKALYRVVTSWKKLKSALCAPKFDEATEYSYRWAERLREQIGNRMEIILLLISDAVRDKVEKALKDNPDAMLIHYNHGEEDALIGQDTRPVVDLGNVNLLRARESYNMNCLSARTLGKAAYQNGCLAYWGYTEVVSFTSDAEENFCEAFNCGLLLRLEGKSWKECLELTKAKMTEIIDDLVKRGNTLAAMSLREDRDSLHCWGKDIEEPREECPVSRFTVFLFGYKTLSKLRKIRNFLAKHPQKIPVGYCFF